MMTESLDPNDKNLLIAYFGNYGKKIIETLEEVLANIGATKISIVQNKINFSVNGYDKHIDLQEMMKEIFMLPKTGVVDERLANEEEMYYKSLQVIQDTLRRLS